MPKADKPSRRSKRVCQHGHEQRQRQHQRQRQQRQHDMDDDGSNSESEVDPRPTVVITNGDGHTAILREIYGHFPVRPWLLYQKDGALVRVVTAESCTSIERMCVVSLANVLSDLVRLEETVMTSRGSFVKGTQPPQWLLREMLGGVGVAWDARIIPHLEFVSEGPLFIDRPPRILQTNGYNEDAKVLVVGCPANDTLTPQQMMTCEEAKSLLKATLAEFPFETDADLAAAIAMCLTPVARAAIHGPLPLFVIDGFESGQGKTVLADLAVLFAQTRRVRAVTWPKNPEEIEKKIGSMLVGNGRVHVWDNITAAFGGDTLDALLTSETFATRELGKSSMIQAKNTAMWIAGGNNVVLQGDLIRRLVLIRFKPHSAGAGAGAGAASERVFLTKDLIAQASKPNRRYRLLLAAATLLKAYATSGSHHHLLGGAMVSYGAWSNTVRSAAAWVMGVDPLTSQRELSRSLRQQHTERFVAVAEAWFKWKETAPVALGELPASVRETLRPFGWTSNDPAAMNRLRQSFPRQFVASKVSIVTSAGTFRFERCTDSGNPGGNMIKGRVQKYRLVRDADASADNNANANVDANEAAGAAAGAGGGGGDDFVHVAPPCNF